MTKRAEKWPVIGCWWHHPRNIIRGGLDIVTDKTKKKKKPKAKHDRARLRRLLLATWETGQSEAVIPMACINIATRSDRNEPIKAFHCFKKTRLTLTSLLWKSIQYCLIQFRILRKQQPIAFHFADIFSSPLKRFGLMRLLAWGDFMIEEVHFPWSFRQQQTIKIP